MTLETGLIKYRREKAAETIEDARILFEKRRLSSAVNRIYYALFYEVNALLKTRELVSSKHTGVRALFNMHFVKPGIVPVEIGKFYSKMFDFRQEGDYDDFIYFEEEKVKEWLEAAEKYIQVLEGCIEKELAGQES
jgi:uncharacterized protein (UPF0332 family)